MKQKTLAPVKKNPPEPPKPEDFSSRQMVLFQDLLCNTVTERESLSNVFDLWDSIPRYVVSRQQQDKWRKAGDFPQLHYSLITPIWAKFSRFSRFWVDCRYDAGGFPFVWVSAAGLGQDAASHARPCPEA